MGFYLNLLIAIPTNHIVQPQSTSWRQREIEPSQPHKTFTLWNIESIVGIDRVTRLEKITAKHFKHIQHVGKERAAICVVNDLFPYLLSKLQKTQKSDFAPPFTINKADTDSVTREFSSILDWNRENLTFEKVTDGGEFTVPIYGITTSQQIPSQEMMEKHNQVLSLTQEKLAKYVNSDGFQIVYDAPFFSESAEVVSKWFEEMDISNADGFRELIKDPDSLAYFHLWKNYLAGVAKLNAKVIFLFDEAWMSTRI